MIRIERKRPGADRVRRGLVTSRPSSAARAEAESEAQSFYAAQEAAAQASRAYQARRRAIRS
ncbi:MAG TPA: hypothetical protein VF092_15175 [Longimicrobium sp.]